MLKQRRCNVITLYRLLYDVVSTLYARCVVSNEGETWRRIKAEMVLFIYEYSVFLFLI